MIQSFQEEETTGDLFVSEKVKVPTCAYKTGASSINELIVVR